MLTQEVFTNHLIDFQMPRLVENMLLNRILVFIFTESRRPRARVRQIDILSKFNLTKYKCSQILGYMDGACLIEKEGTVEYNYYVSFIGEKYLEKFLLTQNGQIIIKEIADERTI